MHAKVQLFSTSATRYVWHWRGRKQTTGSVLPWKKRNHSWIVKAGVSVLQHPASGVYSVWAKQQCAVVMQPVHCWFQNWHIKKNSCLYWFGLPKCAGAIDGSHMQSHHSLTTVPLWLHQEERLQFKLLQIKRGCFGACTQELAGSLRDAGVWRRPTVWVGVEWRTFHSLHQQHLARLILEYLRDSAYLFDTPKPFSYNVRQGEVALTPEAQLQWHPTSGQGQLVNGGDQPRPVQPLRIEKTANWRELNWN